MRAAGYDEAVVAAATVLRAQVDAFYRGGATREAVQVTLAQVRDEPWFPHAYVGAELPLAPQRSKGFQEMDYEPLAVWAQVQVPALFVYGEADRWVPIEESIQRYRAARQHVPDVTFTRVAGADHLMAPLAHADESSGEVVADYPRLLRPWLCQRLGVGAPDGAGAGQLSSATFTQRWRLSP